MPEILDVYLRAAGDIGDTGCRRYWMCISGLPEISEISEISGDLRRVCTAVCAHVSERGSSWSKQQQSLARQVALLLLAPICTAFVARALAEVGRTSPAEPFEWGSGMNRAPPRFVRQLCKDDDPASLSSRSAGSASIGRRRFSGGCVPPVSSDHRRDAQIR